MSVPSDLDMVSKQKPSKYDTCKYCGHKHYKETMLEHIWNFCNVYCYNNWRALERRD